MSIDWTDVVNVDPALATVPAGSQDSIIADVYLMLDASRWGVKLDLGAKYLAAHFGVLALRGGAAAGPVTSERLGDAATSYAAPQLMRPDGLALTAWGTMFMTIARGVIGLGAVVL